jgi:hypothetical protein
VVVVAVVVGGGSGLKVQNLSYFGMDSVFLTEESILDPGYEIWEYHR